MWGILLLTLLWVFCGAQGLIPPQQPLVFPKYHNEKVVRITEDPKNVVLLLTSANNITYKKWGSSTSEKFVDIHVDEDNYAALQLFLFRHKVIIENLAQAIAETMPQQSDSVVETTQIQPLSEIFFREYRPLETIDAWLDILQQTFPDILLVEEIGQTYEHRALKIVHISRPSDIDHDKKKTVVVTGGTHAREWISVSSVCYAIYQLLQLYLEEPKKISEQLDFLFIPVITPTDMRTHGPRTGSGRKTARKHIFPSALESISTTRSTTIGPDLPTGLAAKNTRENLPLRP